LLNILVYFFSWEFGNNRFNKPKKSLKDEPVLKDETYAKLLKDYGLDTADGSLVQSSEKNVRYITFNTAFEVDDGISKSSEVDIGISKSSEVDNGISKSSEVDDGILIL
jgi:hypothetical protein